MGGLCFIHLSRQMLAGCMLDIPSHAQVVRHRPALICRQGCVSWKGTMKVIPWGFWLRAEQDLP